MKLRALVALSSAALLTLAFALVSGAGPPPCSADADSDGVCDDSSDNCLGVSNAAQRDDDEDGYGNICDWDVTQDCSIGGPDVVAVFQRSFTSNPWSPKSDGAYDINEDNSVGGSDVIAVFQNSFGVVGPTSRTCADCTATPAATLGAGSCPATP